MYDIIIIGAGPAGMTAALYAKRAEKKVLVLEAINYGGKIINTLSIDNYPSLPHISGFDFATNLYNQIKELKCEIKFERVISLKNNKDNKEVKTDKEIYYGKTVIIATGNKNKLLGLPNEQDLVGRGISYCATCDGQFFKNKDVAVVGGGNTALDDAIYLSNFCNKIYLIHRRDSFSGDESLIKTLKQKKNIKYILNSHITKLIGDNKLQSIEIKDNNEKTKTIDLSGLFVAVGNVPENDIFKDLINLDEYGYIIADDNCHTNIEGIYSAGDARAKYLRQLVTATSDGAVAATAACAYIDTL